MDDEVLARREEAPPGGQAGAKAALHRVRQGVVLAADLVVEFGDVLARAVGDVGAEVVLREARQAARREAPLQSRLSVAIRLPPGQSRRAWVPRSSDRSVDREYRGRRVVPLPESDRSAARPAVTARVYWVGWAPKGWGPWGSPLPVSVPRDCWGRLAA